METGNGGAGELRKVSPILDFLKPILTSKSGCRIEEGMVMKDSLWKRGLGLKMETEMAIQVDWQKSIYYS